MEPPFKLNLKEKILQKNMYFYYFGKGKKDRFAQRSVGYIRNEKKGEGCASKTEKEISAPPTLHRLP